jgi:thiol-disulfide isomerase/thioredoxin
MKKLIIWVIFIIAAIFIFFFYVADNISAAPELDYRQLEIVDMENNVVETDNFSNKVLVINFWATWCGPCVKEMPTLEKAKVALQGEDVEFLIISDETMAQIENFRKKNNYTLDFYKSLSRLTTYNITSYPTTYIIDKQGNVEMSKTGYHDWGQPSVIEKLRELAAR